MKYLVAVSGGVDSVVLLDMLASTNDTLVVAHVDHGIRVDSAADARFVEGLAKKYHRPFVSARLKLGAHASEDRARRARYAFLHEQAEKFGARIVTAHHQEDVLETIAINLTRGTGWRGLAVMGRADITRPLLHLTKKQIYNYAASHRLEWVEDETNATDRYLRNRIRRKIYRVLPESTCQAAMCLRAQQLQLRRDMARETTRLLGGSSPTRHFLTQIDHEVALEILGTMCEREAGVRPIRPQLERALLAIKTAKPRTRAPIGESLEMTFASRTFAIKRV